MTMLTVQEALSVIVREVQPFAATPVLLADAFSLVLAEDIVSDIDSPPFDKALMDGFAVRSADVAGGHATLRLIEEVTAGRVPSRPVVYGEATQIMTGAPMPTGADAVVPVEDTEIDSASHTVRIATRPVSPGVNVMHRGTSMRSGECVVPTGRKLRPQELGALAEMGRYQVLVHPRPTVGVLATGDELVPISETPAPGEIRNSNETMLVAQIRRAGAEPVPLGIAPDEPSQLGRRIDAAVGRICNPSGRNAIPSYRQGSSACDLLLLSGGVSAGKRDLVPSALRAAGVRQVFHKVHVKPGKPVWFGVVDSSASDTRRYVFALPGNPVSSMVCFELFVRTAIRRLMGVEPSEPKSVRAKLAEEHTPRDDRPTYCPARLDWTPTGPVVRPVNWQGSADLRATVEANAMALFLPGEATYRPGETIDVYCW